MAPRSGALKIVRVCSASDGDRNQWPNRGLSREDPGVYLVKLATKYMQDIGEAKPGEKYRLDRLPTDYALYGKARHNDVNHIDRYLYGHPNYKFRSAEEFYEHFRTLMVNGSALGCQCIGCSGGRKRANKVEPSPYSLKPGRVHAPDPARISNPLPLAPVDIPDRYRRSTTPDYDKVDREGTPDVYRNLSDRLFEDKSIDQHVTEMDSYDWRINRKSIVKFFSDISAKPAYLPRMGELVLFVRGLVPSHIITVGSEGQCVLWDKQQEVFLTMPPWEAGVVTGVAEESLDTPDLVMEQPRRYQVNYAGFRVEPMSDTSATTKVHSKNVAQVRLHQLRPFYLYRDMLKNIKPRQYHDTVKHALGVMASFSLIEKYHFRGQWPNAHVFCRGMYIGAELITVGDTVRIMPGLTALDREQIWDVMTITSIKLKMVHLDARENPDYGDATDPDGDPRHEYDCSVHVDGIAFTRDQIRAWNAGDMDVEGGDPTIPPILRGYGHWYHLHDPRNRWKVPFSKILGRVFEAQAMKLWFSSANLKAASLKAPEGGKNDASGIPTTVVPAQRADISAGLVSIQSARNFSADRDERIQKYPGKTWFWADNRVEQLDLHDVRGQTVQDVLYGEVTRDVPAWDRAFSIRKRGAGFRAKGGQAHAVVPAGGPSHGDSLVSQSAVGAGGMGELADLTAQSEEVVADGDEDGGEGDEIGEQDMMEVDDAEYVEEVERVAAGADVV